MAWVPETLTWMAQTPRLPGVFLVRLQDGSTDKNPSVVVVRKMVEGLWYLPWGRTEWRPLAESVFAGMPITWALLYAGEVAP